MKRLFILLMTVFVLVSILNTSGLAKGNNYVDPYFTVIYNHIACYKNPDECGWLTGCILHYCRQYNVDPLLVTALFSQESHFRMEARSPTGAIGIAQIQPATAQALGIDPYDPEQNIEGGIRYLAQQLCRFANRGDWAATYAIAAYNAGAGSIERYNDIPPYSETRNHVNVICDIYVELLNGLKGA